LVFLFVFFFFLGVVVGWDGVFFCVLGFFFVGLGFGLLFGYLGCWLCFGGFLLLFVFFLLFGVCGVGGGFD